MRSLHAARARSARGAVQAWELLGTLVEPPNSEHDQPRHFRLRLEWVNRPSHVRMPTKRPSTRSERAMQEIVSQAANAPTKLEGGTPLEIDPASLPPLPFAVQSAPPMKSAPRRVSKSPRGSAGRSSGKPTPLPVDEKELVKRLLGTFHSGSYTPPMLPTVAVELLELSRKPDIPYSAIRALLEKDALVAARVLRIAQSPVFATRTPLHSLQDALMRLGLKNLTHIFVEAALHLRVFRAPKYEHAMNRLRCHSTATAYAARIVCRFASQMDDFAFLCGLLHDVGIAASLVMIGEGLIGPPPSFEHVWPAISHIHEEAGGLLLGAWKLPADIREVVSRHHKVTIDGQSNSVVAAVCLGDHFATELGHGFESGMSEDIVLEARRVLGISDVTRQLIVDETREATKHVL